MIIRSCRIALPLLSLLFIFSGLYGQESFREQQKRFSRVSSAYEEKLEGVSALLNSHNIVREELELLLIAYKKEKDLEVWAKNRDDDAYKKVVSYNFCVLSGEPGPKREQGDLQVPEGFYYITVFNPWSSFHLSLGLNYPNQSDRILGIQGRLGGDIYIHGSCVSIGCIPITDRKIKELYVLCVEAKSEGQDRIPVHLYPARLDPGVKERLIQRYNPDQATIDLWDELEKAYQYFDKTKQKPEISFLQNGRHLIN